MADNIDETLNNYDRRNLLLWVVKQVRRLQSRSIDGMGRTGEWIDGQELIAIINKEKAALLDKPKPEIKNGETITVQVADDHTEEMTIAEILDRVYNETLTKHSALEAIRKYMGVDCEN